MNPHTKEHRMQQTPCFYAFRLIPGGPREEGTRMRNPPMCDTPSLLMCAHGRCLSGSDQNQTGCAINGVYCIWYYFDCVFIVILYLLRFHSGFVSFRMSSNHSKPSITTPNLFKDHLKSIPGIISIL